MLELIVVVFVLWFVFFNRGAAPFVWGPIQLLAAIIIILLVVDALGLYDFPFSHFGHHLHSC